MRILAASDYRLLYNCMTCQHRNICLNTLFFHIRSTSETVFPAPSALYSYKAIDSAGQAERNSKQIESIHRKITHTSMQLKSLAISAISLQRSLNGVKLTKHSPQYLHHSTHSRGHQLNFEYFPCEQKAWPGGGKLQHCRRDLPFLEQVVMKTLFELFCTPWKQIKLTAHNLQKTDEAF